jgi:hypothetical protein
MKLRRSLIAGGMALLLTLFSAASMAFVNIGLSITVAPPELPVYEQPSLPGPGYVWVPGYWAWGEDGYYWVPGTWVLPPAVGLLWTPGYWGWANGLYVWNAGYWGPHVGFYGGINYGFGYFGAGYEGGYWDHDRFFYNRSCNNVSDVHITNVYNRTVVNNVNVNRVSYNGGAIGVHAQPSQADLRVAHERHMGLAPMQVQHEQAARNDPELRARFNAGHPPIVATPRPAALHDRGIVGNIRVPQGQTIPEARTSLQPHAPSMPAAAPARNGFTMPAHNGFEPSGHNTYQPPVRNGSVPPAHNSYAPQARAFEPPTRYTPSPRNGYPPQTQARAYEPPSHGAFLSPNYRGGGSGAYPHAFNTPARPSPPIGNTPARPAYGGTPHYQGGVYSEPRQARPSVPPQIQQPPREQRRPGESRH